MTTRPRSRVLAVVTAVAGAAVLALGLVPSSAAAATPTAVSAGRNLPPDTEFFTPQPDPGALRQIDRLTSNGDKADAAAVRAMVRTPQAVWLTGGTPAQVERAAHQAARAAAAQGTVPVFVAYDLPFRDCGQYSAGGATDTAAYLAWVDGVARGIGSVKAVILLEPDGLGIIPYNTDLNGNQEWCRPDLTGAGLTPQEANAARYVQINGAVDRLEQQARTTVYLDGTHSGWLGVGDISARLVKAGVNRAQGFFVNVSNFQATPQLTKYGSWISQCIAFAANPADGGWRLGSYSSCASQYYPANPDDFSTWALTDAWYAANLGSVTPTAHYVVDTSRNGNGPADMTRYSTAPYNQPADVVSVLAGGSWCNPPGAALGLRPTARTRQTLLDAYLWVKTPGQSDGQCDAAGGTRAWDYTAYSKPGWPTDAAALSHFDPLWGQVDPAAGDWFAAQALQLARSSGRG